MHILRTLNLIALVAAVTLVPVLTGCSDSSNPVDNNPSDTTEAGILTGDISGSRTLSADTVYKLRGVVFIQPGAVLTIPAGTKILGDSTGYASGNTVPSALVTLPGENGLPSGRLEAVGTATNPIVFTSALPAGHRARSNWGGVILMGMSDVNIPGKKPAIEGITGSYGPGTQPVNTADNSGTLKYVRVEYGGIKVSTDNEINGFTFGAVGSGTTIDYLQSHMIADDGYEWFGGTVHAKHLVSSANDDDAFDMDNGFSGRLQYLFGVQDPNLANRGFEVDNDADGSDNQPYTSTISTNVTLIGTGKDKANDDNNDGLYLRRNCKIKTYNALITGFRMGFVIDGTNTLTNFHNGELVVKNSIIDARILPYCDKNGDSTGFGATVADWGLRLGVDAGVSYPATFPNPNPMPNNEVLTGAMDPSTLDPFFDSTNYIGAFAPGGPNWATGWTNYALN